MATSKQRFHGKGDLAIRPESVGLTWPRSPGEDSWNPSVCRDGVAVIKVCGPLEHHGGMWFESYEKLLNCIEGAMQDDEVHAILLDIDSPGGEVSGLQETVRKIRAMRKEYGKPVVAYADEEAYSAAYAIACAADEIYLPESGGVGSIGVLAEVCDRTAMTKEMGLRIEVVRSGARKAEGHPDIPLSDATIARVQKRVDGLADQFFALVSKSRGVPKEKLDALQGQCVYGGRAVALDLADGIASFDEVFAALAEESFDNARNPNVSFKPTDRSVGGGETMLDVLKRKVAKAAAALAEAKTSAAKKSAMAAYTVAVQALADARAKSKVKKSYKKKTVEEEEETDDGEPDDDDDDDGDDDDDDADEADESKKGKKTEEEEEEEEEGEEGEEEEEGKKMKKGKKAAASGSLLSFVKSLTGQSSTRAAKEVLASMHEQATSGAEALERVRALEAAVVESERKELVNSMLAAGQLKPSQLDWAKAQSIKSLKSYRKATPAMFAPRIPSRGGMQTEAPDADGLTPVEREVVAKTGMSVKAYKEQRDLERGVAAPKVN